jgi:hypothetical protein
MKDLEQNVNDGVKWKRQEEVTVVNQCVLEWFQCTRTKIILVIGLVLKT